jgi:endonuclease/exonuclease/phosphatase family metal-dependent hydrolase
MQVAAWTNYWPESDRYERMDYLLISQSLRADWVAAESFVLARHDWRIASDHRPVVAEFRA